MTILNIVFIYILNILIPSGAPSDLYEVLPLPSSLLATSLFLTSPFNQIKKDMTYEALKASVCAKTSSKGKAFVGSLPNDVRFFLFFFLFFSFFFFFFLFFSFFFFFFFSFFFFLFLIFLQTQKILKNFTPKFLDQVVPILNCMYPPFFPIHKEKYLTLTASLSLQHQERPQLPQEEQKSKWEWELSPLFVFPPPLPPLLLERRLL